METGMDEGRGNLNWQDVNSLTTQLLACTNILSSSMFIIIFIKIPAIEILSFVHSVSMVGTTV